MKIPILNGIYTDNESNFRTSYPINYVVVPKSNGIDTSFIRPFYGIVEFCECSGIDRGGINWNGDMYRVIGGRLYQSSQFGTLTDLGNVGSGSYVSMDYSFDRLGIASQNKLWLYDATNGLVQVTDPDLGTVLDMIWIDGYFMTTDGTYVVVTELNDPTSVNPLKYGTTDVDPDPIKALLKLHGEAMVLNRYTIQSLNNVGGSNFPFDVNQGAKIMRGTIGTHTCCVFIDSIAFVGSGRNEAPAIYIAANASTQKVSTMEIDEILQRYTENELALCKLETLIDRSHQYLIFHLADKSLCYDYSASQEVGSPCWTILISSETEDSYSAFRGQNYVYCYDKWICGDTNGDKLGYLSNTVSSHFGDTVRWEFSTQIVYNESRGAIFHELELVALTGRVALGVTPYISTSYSLDGETWSQPKYIQTGTIGDRMKRLHWLQQGFMKNWRIQRFQGDSNSHAAFARLEARLEPLES